MTTSTRTFERIWRDADAAGRAAAEACTPATMIVGSPTHPLGSDIDPRKPVYVVPSGVCGYAWVNFPGNTAFGRWAKSTGRATKSYYGGLDYRVTGYGQSMERKEAYARAFAAVLIAGGIAKVYVQSRMD
jgi:hypothetical protein